MSCTLQIFGVGAARERAAEHGEVLREHVDDAAIDRAPAGDDAVAGDFVVLHAELGGAVLDEHVELLERAFVEQQLHALARGELALGVLRRHALLAPARTRGGARLASRAAMMSFMGGSVRWLEAMRARRAAQSRAAKNRAKSQILRVGFPIAPAPQRLRPNVRGSTDRRALRFRRRLLR